jgi:hypothetical protein
MLRQALLALLALGAASIPVPAAVSSLARLLDLNMVQLDKAAATDTAAPAESVAEKLPLDESMMMKKPMLAPPSADGDQEDMIGLTWKEPVLKPPPKQKPQIATMLLFQEDAEADYKPTNNALMEKLPTLTKEDDQFETLGGNVYHEPPRESARVKPQSVSLLELEQAETQPAVALAAVEGNNGTPDVDPQLGTITHEKTHTEDPAVVDMTKPNCPEQAVVPEGSEGSMAPPVPASATASSASAKDTAALDTATAPEDNTKSADVEPETAVPEAPAETKEPKAEEVVTAETKPVEVEAPADAPVEPAGTTLSPVVMPALLDLAVSNADTVKTEQAKLEEQVIHSDSVQEIESLAKQGVVSSDLAAERITQILAETTSSENPLTSDEHSLLSDVMRTVLKLDSVPDKDESSTKDLVSQLMNHRDNEVALSMMLEKLGEHAYHAH